MRLDRYKREISAFAAFAALLIIVGVVKPSFFSFGNLRDLVVINSPALLLATGMTMVMIVGQIDISVGSQFAVCSVAAGVIAKLGVPLPLVLIGVILLGSLMGSVNGLLIGRLKLPSIIVTLAMLVLWRDALRWATDGAWVQDLPDKFQWFGVGQRAGELSIVLVTLLIFLLLLWAMRNLSIGRRLYAVGSDFEAARLTGINGPGTIVWVFALMGALTGIAAMMNVIRFSSIPGNMGIGFELKAIAAVVVGGTAISGGRGNLIGTLAGVLLLGTIGTSLTFLGINPFWEKAIQGAIILVALVSDVALGGLGKNGRLDLTNTKTA